MLKKVTKSPYVERISRIESQTGSDGVKRSVSKDIFNNKTLMLLPENLRINSKFRDKVLSRDNYKTHAYQGEVELSGNFNLEALPESSGYNTIEWDKAFIAIGLSNNKSVEASSPLRWEGSSAAFKPGTQLPTLLKNGFHASLEDVANDNPSPQFKMLLNLKGMDSFQFAPFGEITIANLSSNNTKLKIHGDLPASSKVSSDDTFEATWRISSLSRNYPQQWLIEDDNKVITTNFSSVLTGVKFLDKTSIADENHLKIKNILKYLLVILAIVFFSLFILEFKPKNRPKPTFIHYVVISLPILLMPILLFTLINLMNFMQAYQIAVGSCILVIVLYVMSALKSFGKGFYLLMILAAIFAALFVILQMPEYALFAISAAGIGIIILQMMVSINIQDR